MFRQYWTPLGNNLRENFNLSVGNRWLENFLLNHRRPPSQSHVEVVHADVSAEFLSTDSKSGQPVQKLRKIVMYIFLRWSIRKFSINEERNFFWIEKLFIFKELMIDVNSLTDVFLVTLKWQCNLSKALGKLCRNTSNHFITSLHNFISCLERVLNII